MKNELKIFKSEQFGEVRSIEQIVKYYLLFLMFARRWILKIIVMQLSA